jgi:hypothetical protein
VINQSLRSGIFPDLLKIAKVLPLLKKDDPLSVDNYRPISLLPATSKIFEKIVFDQLYNYLVNNKLLYKHQYGFRRLHSTELAALELIDQITLNLESNKTPLCIYLDLSKAFDTLNHEILLHKLSFYGINNISHDWFRNYLNGRKQYVNVNGMNSEKTTLMTGVPQGSILGPLLFVIYINDITFASSKFHKILYADDTTLFATLESFSNSSGSNRESLSNMINKELQLVQDWLSLNKLSLNTTKTKYMIFRRPQKIINEHLNLILSNATIEHVTDFNFLGLTVNETLSWKGHISKIANKISRSIGIIKRMKNFVPPFILKMIYNSLIVPHIYYGITAWGHDFSRIHKLQKYAIRLITKSKYNSHTEPILKKIECLKVADIYVLQCMKLFHKYKNNQLPTYFHNMFPENASFHSYNTRNRNDTHIPYSRTSAARKTIRHKIPILFRNLPRNVTEKTSTHSLDGFSGYLKRHLLSKYSVNCTIPNCYVCGRNAN